MRRGTALKIADTAGQDVAIEKKRTFRGPIIGSAAIVALLSGAWLAVPGVGRWLNATVTVSA